MPVRPDSYPLGSCFAAHPAQGPATAHWEQGSPSPSPQANLSSLGVAGSLGLKQVFLPENRTLLMVKKTCVFCFKGLLCPSGRPPHPGVKCWGSWPRWSLSRAGTGQSPISRGICPLRSVSYGNARVLCSGKGSDFRQPSPPPSPGRLTYLDTPPTTMKPQPLPEPGHPPCPSSCVSRAPLGRERSLP